MKEGDVRPEFAPDVHIVRHRRPDPTRPKARVRAAASVGSGNVSAAAAKDYPRRMAAPPHDPLEGLSLPPDVAARVRALPSPSSIPLGTSLAERRLALAVAAAADPSLLATALAPLLDAVAPARGALSPFARAVDHHLRGIVAWRLRDDAPGAVTSWNRAVALLRTCAGDGGYLGRVHDGFGQLLHHQGLLVDAREAYETALTAKRAADDAPGVALTLGNLGRLCLALGDYRAATTHLEEDLAFVRADPRRDTRLETQLLVQLGAAATELGQLADARRHLDAADSFAAAGHDPVGLAFVRIYRGRLSLREGDLPAASARAEEATEALGGVPATAVPEVRGLVAELSARVRWARDDLVGAAERVEEAERLFAASSRVPPVERASLHELHASIAEAAGRRREAVAALRRALVVLDATSVDSMRTRIDEALRRLDETAWMLHASGRFVGHAQLEELLGEAGRQGFRGREDEAVVLFSDLRGFTRTGESLSADVLVATLNRYLGLMTRCVERFGGRVDKFIGDAVMAVFTARAGAEPPADRALAAAAYMAADLERFGATLPEAVGPLRAGIGLHAGTVVAGLVGSPQKRSWTVLGDVVNTASRVEGMTKLLDAPILVTEEVVARTGAPHRVVTVPLGRWRPVGRRAPVEVFLVAGSADGSPEAEAALALAADAAGALGVFRDGRFADAAILFDALAARAGDGRGARAFERLAAAARAFASSPPPNPFDSTIDLPEK
jgi:class 3 adenylate cyclase